MMMGSHNCLRGHIWLLLRYTVNFLMGLFRNFCEMVDPPSKRGVGGLGGAPPPPPVLKIHGWGTKGIWGDKRDVIVSFGPPKSLFCPSNSVYSPPQTIVLFPQIPNNFPPQNHSVSSNSISSRPQNHSVPPNSVCGLPFWDLEKQKQCLRTFFAGPIYPVRGPCHTIICSNCRPHGPYNMLFSFYQQGNTGHMLEVYVSPW